MQLAGRGQYPDPFLNLDCEVKVIYYTVKQKPASEQTTLLDLLKYDMLPKNRKYGSISGTITRTLEAPTGEMTKVTSVQQMKTILMRFNSRHEALFEKDRHTMYRHFTIPKRTGGLRKIDAPCEELQNALRELKYILSEQFDVMYHTSAFAYVKNRSITQAVEKHQKNASNWFLKTDFSGFFPSTTLDFAMKMLGMVFPLSELCKDAEGKEALRKALSLAFLDGGLPQGTVLSPSLTNMIMIPIDHALFNEFAHHKCVYTRYADDIHISAVEHFDKNKMIQIIRDTLKKFDAPYKIKDEKTHYGSRSGKNWMLGCMLNKDNNITVGFRRKKYWKAMTSNLIMDYKHGKHWERDDVMHYQGLTSYYLMVEPEYFKEWINNFEEKYNVNWKMVVKQMLTW